MFSVQDSIPHRLVGLFLAVLMPLCCCTTHVFGDAVIDGEDRGLRSSASCCSHASDGTASESNESTGTNDRCNCVRGHLGGGIQTSTIIDTLAVPAIAHPASAANDQGLELDTELDRPAAREQVPPDDPGSTPSARQLRRIVVLQV